MAKLVSITFAGFSYVKNVEDSTWTFDDGEPVHDEDLIGLLEKKLLDSGPDKVTESVKPDMSSIPTAAPQVAEPIKSIPPVNPEALKPPTLPRVESREEPKDSPPIKTITQQIGENFRNEMGGSTFIGNKIFQRIQDFISSFSQKQTPKSNVDAERVPSKPTSEKKNLNTIFESIQKDVSEISKMIKEGERIRIKQEGEKQKERQETEDTKDEAETQEAIKKEEGERGRGKYLTVSQELNQSFGRNLVAEMPGLNLLKEARQMQQDPKSGIGGTDILGGILPSKKFMKSGLKAGAAGLILGTGSYLMDQQAQEAEEEGDKQSSAAWKVGSTAAEWAAYGAAAGSFIPGVGTLAGGAIAGLGGAIVGASENWDDLIGEKQNPRSVSPMPKAATAQQTTNLVQSNQQLKTVQKAAETKAPVVVNNDNKVINNNNTTQGGIPSMYTPGYAGSLFQLAT